LRDGNDGQSQRRRLGHGDVGDGADVVGLHVGAVVGEVRGGDRSARGAEGKDAVGVGDDGAGGVERAAAELEGAGGSERRNGAVADELIGYGVGALVLV
jgi:hypothetical protein